jgi:hypothetical protein
MSGDPVRERMLQRKQRRVVLLLACGALAAAMADGLQEIVEASGTGIRWADYERMTGPERMNAAVRIGSALARSRPQGAWGDAKRLPGSDDREFLMRGILLDRADRDASAGLRELMELPEGGERGLLGRAFFARWAESSPAQAGGDIGRLPAGMTRDAAVDAVLTRWIAADAPAAARWASQLPATRQGPVKQLPIIGMAGHQNLTGVGYERGDAMQLAAFEWAKRDGPAARNWAQAEANPELRTVLLRLVTAAQ